MRRAIIFLALMAALAVLSACDNGAVTASDSRNMVAGPFDNFNLEPLAADPDKYIGSLINLTGRVIDRPSSVDGGAWRLQVQADPDESETRFYVVVSADRLDIGADDFVSFGGTLEVDPEKNRLEDAGEELPFISADDFQQIPSQNILDPTNKLLEPNVSESQFNVTVTVEKIEFAERETRVYMRIDNGTEQTVRLNDGRMKLSQGPKESGLQPDPAPDYDRLPADLPTEMSATGILTFPPASYEEGSLRLTIGASTDDYTLRFEPFELAVVWTPSAE